ncbi:aminodeoxychorismate synthase component I [Actinokineospora fastidiosa]|uniref:aminodeoxychorismate synthase n=1 Tax=Actinokineospora fastidiosa TaxID=1816 RepID=A0A918GG21_9PSEU|nr:aminodeoxychorismate synthase component I [Actinokineospora fastidiosa]GGS33321.1 aminodeoxychorismate synthase, component I [Actinokineospora fastidiosa]
MRTLIVDNHDSFTYNLYQALASLDGARPTVVRNDEDWDLGGLADFDNVVISPGPGHPAKHRDFGLSAAVLAAARQPLLGVCLGHQGLCLLAGAQVGHAPQVRHGRLSTVHHDGRDLFDGLPNPLRVVRYHSLTVTDLPPELEPTAWADDGVLMGVRHRDRPAWGVQFHPESVCTERGLDLLANFAAMTRRHHAEQPRERITLAPRAQAPNARVLVRHLTLPVTAEEAFDAFYRDSEHAFWLDSAGGGRFSYLGDASGPLARVATADVQAGTVTVQDKDGTHVHHGSFLDWLDADLARWRVDVPYLPFGFALGWVGYLGYELKAETGGSRAHASPDPDAALVFADRVIVFDHQTEEIHLLALDSEEAEHWLDETSARLLTLSPLPAPGAQPRVGGLTARHDRAAYLAMIDECLAAIRDGESYEVCLTNELTAPAELDPWATYRRLRVANPAPFGAFLRFGDRAVLSASPERFLAVSSDGMVESRPIKGTRPRGRTPEEDAALRHDLATAEKDRAENLMIVDLVRNDLGVYAEVGSVHVPALFQVESYATVHQLVSTVRARLAEGVSAVRCLRAAFPGGSMTGAPKERTMEIIDHLERGPRGVYSGALGWFSLTGAADLSMVIRTLVVRPGEVAFGVGGAVVALSDPGEEYEETAVKAAALVDLLGVQFPGRASVR